MPNTDDEPLVRIITDRLDHVERLRNSRDGNPRFNIHLVGGNVHTTKKDAQVGHNIAGMDHDALKGRLVQLALDYDGRIPAYVVLGFNVIDEPGNVAQKEHQP